MAPPLGPPESVRESSPSSPELGKLPHGHIGTVRIRPLIDLGQARIVVTVEKETGRPSDRTIVSHAADREPRTYRAPQFVPGEDVVPGFALSVEDVFDL